MKPRGRCFMSEVSAIPPRGRSRHLLNASRKFIGKTALPKTTFVSTNRLAGIYLFIGILWIACSDKLLLTMVPDAQMLTKIQMYKGWAFVLMSGLLIYYLLDRELRRRLQAEEGHAITVDAVQLGTWDLDLVQKKSRRSLRHDEIFGYRSLQAEWNLDIFLAHVLPEDRERAAESFSRALTTGEFTLDCRIQGADQTIRWIEARGRTSFDGNRRPVRMAGIVEDVTERMKAESAVRASERTLKSILAASPVGIGLSVNREMMWVNDAWAHMLGFENPSHCLGHEARKLYESDEECNRTGTHLYQNLSSGVVKEIDAKMRRRDGSSFHACLRMTALDPEDLSAGQLAVIADITERKSAEEALNESEERNRFLAEVIEHSSQPFVSGQADGSLRSFNTAYCNLVGYTREEMRHVNWVEDLTPPEYREMESRRLSELALTGEPVRYEKEYLRKDGSRIPIELLAHVKTDDAGKPLYYYAFITELTDRKRTEAALRASEAKLSSALEMAHLGHWEYDVAKDLFTFNDHFYKIFRTNVEQVGGYTMSSADYARRFVHPEDMHLVGDEIRKTLEDHDRRSVAELEHRIIYADGEVGYISVRLFIVRDSLGRPIRTYGVNQDITDRKRAEDALQESEARVRMKLDSILLPKGDIGNLELADVIDTRAIQNLMDDFFALTNVGLGIIDLEGKILASTGWQDICTKFHRLHPESRRHCLESDTLLSEGVERGSFKLYKCKNNMWDIATPIIVGGKHIGNLFLGQFLFEDEIPDRELFRAQARQYGFDEEQYLVALENVPRWSRQTIDTVMTFYIKFANILSTLSYSNIKLARSLAEQERLINSVRESEQRYRAVVDNVEVGISLLNPDMEIVETNKSLRRNFPNVRAACGQICYEQFNDPPGAAPCSYCPCALTFQDGKVHKVITETPTGSEIRHYRIISSPVLDSDGRVQYVIELIEDITERVKAQEDLERETNRLKGILDVFNDGVYIVNTQHNIEYVNPVMDATFGPVNGKKCYEYIHGRSESCPACWSPEVLAGKSVEREFHADKVGKTYEVFETLLRNIDGSSSKLVFFHDITDRKAAEEDRVRLVTAIKQAAETVVMTDASGKILYVNPAFERTTGYSSEEAIGNNPRVLKSGLHEERFYENIWATIKSGAVWNGHFINRRKDGTLFEEEATISPVKDDSGKIVNYVAVKRDVTKEVSLQKQLLQAQKMEAVGTLAGGIAHDFNNLLQVTLGYSELLLQDLKEGAPEYADLKKIFNAARSGAELVQRLLTFSRKVEPKLVALNLNRQIAQIDELLQRTIPKMIDIRLDLSCDLSEIHADPTQIEQIVMNLAVNARDAMPDGGSLTIRTENTTLDQEYCSFHSGAVPGEYALLTVADTGQGMDKDTVEHMFEPFHTTKELGRGTGLGLAMVYGIVNQHGGHIECYSEVGRGTTFRVYFPAIPAVTEFDPESSAEIPPFGTETILLVDDEDLVRELGKRILSMNGYKVITASNGKEALDLYALHRETISLVVLDLVMPSMGGKDCLNAIRRLDPDAKVLIASGYSADSSANEVLSLGAKGFVGKPFRFKELLLQVRQTLDNA